MPSKKNLLIGGAVAVVVGAAAYAATRKRAPAQSDVVLDELKPIVEPTVAPTPKATTTTAAAPAPAKEASPRVAAGKQDSLKSDFSFNENDANARMLEEALQEQQETYRPAASPAADGVVHLPHLGLKIKPLPGWIVKEELSPMPNIAMVVVSTPALMEAYQDQAEMGSVPMIILSVEDIHGENLDAVEFKERSKQMAMTQMLMMTNGMAQPRIRYDDMLSVGSFTHCLEFTQSLPPILDIVVCNMIAVSNRVSYVFQIMCNQKAMEQYKPMFMDMARSVVIENTGDATIGKVEVTTASGHRMAAHTTWVWNPKPTNGAIAEFTTPSTVRSELISVYEEGKAPSTSAWTVKGTPSTVNGVSVTTFTESRNERKVYTYNGYTAIVKPLQKSLSKVGDASVVAMMQSIAVVTGEGEVATFVNDVHGYRFDVQQGSKLIATRVGGGTIVYAPMGVPADPQQAPTPEQEGPTVTIRFGTPETDPDCASTLDGWKQRLALEKASGTTSDVQETTLSGHKCLTFVSKDMQEVGPGQRLEVMGKVMIFVRNGETTLVRWECPTGSWRKFQSKLDKFMTTFAFLK